MLGKLIVAAALAAATPALAQAPAQTGDIARTYAFAPTGEQMRYRLYVPKSYDPAKPMPLVIVLHGAGGDESRAFDGTGLTAIAERRGYMVLAVRGYSAFGGYGNFYPVVVTKKTAERGKDYGKQGRDPARPRPVPPPEGQIEPAAAVDDYFEQPASQLIDPVVSPLSEREVFTALADVRKDYAIDPKRLYLMGNSAGGVGTLYLASRYPDLFAAISPSAGAIAAWSYPWWRLRQAKLPVLFVHGARDEHANAHWSDVMARDARADGADAKLLLVPDGSHVRAWTMALPQIFDFFAAHSRAHPADPPQ